MPTHLAGWAESQDTGTTETLIAALTESSGYPQRDGDNLRFKAPLNKIAAIFAAFDNETPLNSRMRLQSPTLDKKFTRFYIPEVNDTVEPASLPAINDYRRAPIELPTDENVTARYVADTTAAQAACLLAWLSNGPVAPVDPTGGFWFRYTMDATAQSALAWTTRTLTAETDLPQDQYDVLSAVATSATGIAGRLVFPGQFERPGFLARDDPTKRLSPLFAVPGQMGIMGTIDHRTPPTVELLSSAADAAAANDCWLYLKPRRSG